MVTKNRPRHASRPRAVAILSHRRYEAGAVLGRGAQGTVVGVRDREAPERLLVAKIFQPGRFDEALLLGEFALLYRLRVSGLVRAHDLSRDETTGAPFIVEDYVDGPDARQWIREYDVRDGDDRRTRFKVLAGGIARTLVGLHDAAFVHGDLKPAHVRVENGRPMLLDLGAAVRHSAFERPEDAGGRSAVAVTRAYAAPEILAGAPPSPSSDLYSLGALLWAAAAGGPPKPGRRNELRELAQWVTPSMSDLVATLLNRHPADRPRSAREVLARVGASQPPSSSGDSDAPIFGSISTTPIGRHKELTTLLGSTERVLYVSGSAGVGKSHLLRELVTERLLRGEDTRLVRLPAEPGFVAALVEFFRGVTAAPPFLTHWGRELLLVLDPMERAPDELRSALESYRCRTDDGSRLRVVAATHAAPNAAPSVRLGNLSDPDLDALCRFFGENSAIRRAELVRVADGNPGWLLSALGRMPLGREAVYVKVKALSGRARHLLGAVALLGGEMNAELARAFVGQHAPGVIAELSACGLLSRQGARDDEAGEPAIVLTAPAQATDLAGALATFELADDLAGILLSDARWPGDRLLAVALGPHPPAARAPLLRDAASRARAARLRSVEADALLALAADPRERTPDVLKRLERLTRGGGSGSHPEVLSWIAEVTAREPSLVTLALRRQADDLARKGDYDAAAALLDRAVRTADADGDRTEHALAYAGQGAVALYRGDFRGAKEPLRRATALLDRDRFDDAEEIARLDHNAGIIALYEERTEDAIRAFSDSIERKRALGDRGGVAACLLNLGLALAKASRFDEAVNALEESVLLSRSVAKVTSTAWCLAARAEVEVRRGDAQAAERWIAEAESLSPHLPAAVRTDLVIARAEAALLAGNGAAALACLGDLSRDARGDDALADARALLIEARARLLRVPVDRRQSARLAISAMRIARREGFAEIERQAAEALSRARRSARPRRLDTPPEVGGGTTLDIRDDEMWKWLDGLSTAATRGEAATDLARLVVRQSGAERAFIVYVGSEGQEAFGADIDGLPIFHCEERLDRHFIEQTLRATGSLYQPDFEGAQGRGSRFGVAAGEPSSDRRRSVIVLEHRFTCDRFDQLDPALVRKWCILTHISETLGARGHTPDEEEFAETPSSLRAEVSIVEPSTSLPLAFTRREFPSLVGSSSAFKATLARLGRCIENDLPVLILGETGAGKELFARALHDHGARRARPFVALNCGAIPENLFEAELFGHERGAFTGAERARSGLIAQAEGGTLFLDEIGELPLSRQAALLRAIESRRYRSVGGDVERSFDVRLVAATNRDLEQAARKNGFRGDLLYRINVLQITVPPLRERRDDISPLVQHFLTRAGSRAEVTVEALTALEAYDWPGNVRELEHQILRLVTTSLERIELRHLPRQIRAALRKGSTLRRRSRGESDREQVQRALAATRGNITHAAKVLGLTRHGLKKRMLRLGMRDLPKRATKGSGS